MKDRQVVTRVAGFMTEVGKVGECFIKYNDLQMSGAITESSFYFRKPFISFYNITKYIFSSLFLSFNSHVLFNGAINGEQSGPCSSLPQTGAA